MLTANVLNGKKVFASDVTKEMKLSYVCCERCKEEVRLRYGSIRKTHHFYRKTIDSSLCLRSKGEPETPFHLAAKEAVRKIFNLTVDEVETHLGNAECDIFTLSQFFFEWVELQRSAIPIEEVRDREENARRNNRVLTWGLLIPYKRKESDEDHYGKFHDSEISRNVEVITGKYGRDIARMKALELYLINEKKVYSILYGQELPDGDIRWFRRRFWRKTKTLYYFEDLPISENDLFRWDPRMIEDFIKADEQLNKRIRLMQERLRLEALQTLREQKERDLINRGLLAREHSYLKDDDCHFPHLPEVVFPETRSRFEPASPTKPLTQEELAEIHKNCPKDGCAWQIKEAQRQANGARAEELNRQFLRQEAEAKRTKERGILKQESGEDALQRERETYQRYYSDALLIIQRRIKRGIPIDNPVWRAWEIAREMSVDPRRFEFEIMASRG